CVRLQLRPVRTTIFPNDKVRAKTKFGYDNSFGLDYYLKK
ncbi:MAG: hypothetical protein UT20_C0048G0008, partial [Candidatus Levybacteria bacterium GW2011_GWA1_39_11]